MCCKRCFATKCIHGQKLLPLAMVASTAPPNPATSLRSKEQEAVAAVLEQAHLSLHLIGE